LYSFTFDDFSLGADEMLMASIRMFKDSGFIEAFHIDYEVYTSQNGLVLLNGN
jgi:hypothetical protein